MKVKLGPLVGQASGALGASVASHNRYGTYFRRRAIPITSTTPYALSAKNYLATASAAWRDLTDAQRLQWNSWASSNPIIDRLGDKRILSGLAAYVQLNSRRLLDAQTVLTSPPAVAAPNSLLTTTTTYDIGVGTFQIAYTATPLGATEALWLDVAVLNSTGINYVANLVKLATRTTVAQASPYDYQADAELRFGTLAVGQKIVTLAYVYDRATGLRSAPLRDEGVVVST